MHAPTTRRAREVNRGTTPGSAGRRAGAEEAFLQAWERAHAFLSTQPGYLSTRLHRSLSPSAKFRFVNIALWQSPQAFRAATSQPEFTNAPVPFPFHASLYQVAREDTR